MKPFTCLVKVANMLLTWTIKGWTIDGDIKHHKTKCIYSVITFDYQLCCVYTLANYYNLKFEGKFNKELNMDA